MVYGIITAVTFVLDMASFIRELTFYKSHLWVNAFADVSLLILAAVFIVIDIFYFGWIFCTALKFPQSYFKYIIMGLVGYFKGVKEVMASHLVKLTNKSK